MLNLDEKFCVCVGVPLAMLEKKAPALFWKSSGNKGRTKAGSLCPLECQLDGILSVEAADLPVDKPIFPLGAFFKGQRQHMFFSTFSAS